MLKYAPFAAVAEIASAAKGGHPLKQGKQGAAVLMLQSALVQLGMKLPKSVAKSGNPDGIFGWETFQAVKAFQTEKKLSPDGVVGKKTISLLDSLLVAQSSKGGTPPTLPAVPPPPVNDQYMIGVAAPRILPDTGAGKWKSKPAEASYIALKLAILDILPQATVLIGDDAAKHMFHYLRNTGDRYTIDLEDMVEDVPSAREALEIEAQQAQEFAESLPPGKHQITSKLAEPGYNTKEENWNWFYAIGGYQSWGRADVT
jgi:peptidoglycan hydrolase-like protein with peptidoglycan-binding domain